MWINYFNETASGLRKTKNFSVVDLRAGTRNGYPLNRSQTHYCLDKL